MFKFLILLLILIGMPGYALESHHANYILSLYKSTPGSGINKIDGKSSYILSKNCNGWDTTDELSVVFQSIDNVKSTLSSKWKTFETFSGNSYQFDLDEEINLKKTNQFFGYINSSNGLNSAKYFSDKEYSVPIGTKIEFPVMQLQNIILSAEANQKIYSSNVFMGSELLDSYRVVSVIISKEKKYSKKIIQNELFQNSYWPVSIAYFNPKQETDKPDYTIKAKLQRNGVITEYIIFYDDFSIILNLSSIEGIDKKNCN